MYSVIYIYIESASIIDISGNSNDNNNEANNSAPIKSAPLNSDYTVFANSGNSGIISVTLATSLNSIPLSKFLMLSSNHPHFFINV